jgi:hypothetical protein
MRLGEVSLSIGIFVALLSATVDAQPRATLAFRSDESLEVR